MHAIIFFSSSVFYLFERNYILWMTSFYNEFDWWNVTMTWQKEKFHKSACTLSTEKKGHSLFGKSGGLLLLEFEFLRRFVECLLTVVCSYFAFFLSCLLTEGSRQPYVFMSFISTESEFFLLGLKDAVSSVLCLFFRYIVALIESHRGKNSHCF